MSSVEEQAGCVLEDLPFSKDNWTLVLQGRLKFIFNVPQSHPITRELYVCRVQWHL